MYCENCGMELHPEAVFCTECGTRVDNAYAEQTAALEPVETVEQPEITPAEPASKETQATGKKVQMALNKKLVAGIAAAAVVAAVAVGAITGANIAQHTKAHTLAFNAEDGTAVTVLESDENGTVAAPASTPSRQGYKFEGWFTDETFTTQVVFPCNISEDTTLYAKWSEDNTMEKLHAETKAAKKKAQKAEKAAKEAEKRAAESQRSQNASASRNSASSSEYYLEVEAENGERLSGYVRLYGSRVLPDSDERIYTLSEISDLSDAELCIAWNELCVMKEPSYRFKNSGLRHYFEHVVNLSGQQVRSQHVTNKNIELFKKALDNKQWLYLAKR